MRSVRYAIVLGVHLSVLVLGSCAELRQQHQVPVCEISTPLLCQEELAPEGVGHLLRFYRGLTSLSEKKLQQELAQAKQATASEPTDFERLRLILLLSLPEASVRDRDQARAMLQDFLETHNNKGKGLYDLALLLQGFLRESADQERRYRVLQEKLEQKEEKIRRLNRRHNQEQEWAQSLEQQLENERRRVKKLEQQLEALKTIERRLEHRNQHKETLELPEQSEEPNE